jgi:hypothetical protein
MTTSSPDPSDHVIDIPADQYDVARQYIAAIVARDRRAGLDLPYSRRLSTSLWNQFFAEYVRVSSGPYARRDREALRIALARM